MAQTLRGKATVHSFLGTLTFSAIIANGRLEPQSAAFNHAADIVERTDANSELRGFLARNERYEVTVECLATTADFPTSNAYADAVKGAILPKLFSVVTLAAFEEATRTGDAATYGAPAVNGDYIYKGGGTVTPSSDWLKISIPLVKYAHETAANLTKAVT